MKNEIVIIKIIPHLLGYFEDEEIGIVSRSKSLEIAQQKFLRDQKQYWKQNIWMGKNMKSNGSFFS